MEIFIASVHFDKCHPVFRACPKNQRFGKSGFSARKTVSIMPKISGLFSLSFMSSIQIPERQQPTFGFADFEEALFLRGRGSLGRRAKLICGKCRHIAPPPASTPPPLEKPSPATKPVPEDPFVSEAISAATTAVTALIASLVSGISDNSMDRIVSGESAAVRASADTLFPRPIR
ncbi:hypothetical protein [Roseobacter denitrificans]|uniref:hypothetical protein n=1 Tax=Roseobacter denitrificans TaxID=2434 RepID=UPI000309263D|nr:hypothetical protein [Roseobacter denitrificans]